MILVGVDIAKINHVAAVVDQITGEVLARPFTFKNTAEGFDKFITSFSAFDKNHVLIGMEATGHYMNALLRFLLDRNYQVSIINPVQTDAIRKSAIRKTKTDKIDSMLIIQTMVLIKPRLFTQRDWDLQEMKVLCRHRFRLVQTQSSIKRQLIGCLDQVFPEYAGFFSSGPHIHTSYELLKRYSTPREILKAAKTTLVHLFSKFSKNRFKADKVDQLRTLAKASVGVSLPSISFQIKQLIVQIEMFEAQIEELNSQIKQIVDDLHSPICTVPGISYTLGAIILSEIGDVSRFSDPSKILAYAGLDPSVSQSGKFEASSGKMSKRGSKILRWALLRASFLIAFNNETFNLYYTKKINSGKSHSCAVGHVANKLVRILYKLLSDNIAFNL
jgi:transposase